MGAKDDRNCVNRRHDLRGETRRVGRILRHVSAEAVTNFVSNNRTCNPAWDVIEVGVTPFAGLPRFGAPHGSQLGLL
jgi:hypothetical protein